MKKIGVVILLIALVVFSFAIAQEDNETTPEDPPETSSEGIELAYQCLSDIIDNKDQSELSLQEAVFSTLALGSHSKLTARIEDHKDDSEACYGASGVCTLKDTAQVLLAYDRINRNTADIESWLLSKNGSSSDLTWFLEMDISQHIASSCEITYDDSSHTVEINDDMTLSGNPGSCFTIHPIGFFWLRVKESCLEKTFRISCDEDFITTLLYQKTGSPTIFVSPTTHSAVGLGTTEEKINSLCFKTSGSCDYEGSLWSAIALDQTSQSISAFLPYLLALTEDNKKFFSSTFLYIVTGGNDQFSEITQSQKQDQYWEAPASPYKRFYDSALALLALQSGTEADNARSYFLEIQTPEGCWNNNNIRDTGFLLYAGWPKTVAGESNVGGGTIEFCEDAGVGYCGSTFGCLDTGGTIFESYDCPGLEKCCSLPLVAPPCFEQSGELCSANEQCSGTVTQSFEGSCCLGTCEELPELNGCDLIGGVCSSSCDPDSEEQTFDSCSDSNSVCCVSKTPKKKSSVWLWVFIFSILIILVILAIIFRHRIQLWWIKFRHKRKGKKGPPSGVVSRRPPYPPPLGIRRTIPHRRPPPQRAPPKAYPPRAKTKIDHELEETLKKLREMSK